MENLEVKEKFIELRAKGNSLHSIAVELGVTKQTLINWGKDLGSDIRNQKALEYDALLAKYELNREQKIQSYGKLLQRISAEIENRDISNIKTEKLFELFQKNS